MGLFEKKECELCGNKAGLLTRSKIQGGGYICGDCAARLSPNLKKISQLSLDEVKEQIELKEENDRRFNEEFNMTRVLMIDDRHRIMGVDEGSCEFAILTDKNPDIFRFDQILNFNVDLSTKPLSEEEKKKTQGWAGLLDMLLSDDFGSRYPGLPRCPKNCKIVGMYFEIYLGDNDFHAESMRIDLLPNWSCSETEIDKAYACAYEMSECIKEMKNRSANPDNEGYQEEYGGNEGNEADAGTYDGGAGPSASPIEQVKQLKELLDMGALTQEEFDKKKKELLGL